MGNLLSYSGLSTKIRAMQSKLMTKQQYQEIAHMENVPQALAYLKRQPGYQDLWADVDENATPRTELVKLLTHTIHQNFAKIYKFSNPSQRTFLALYFKRYEIAVMKECLRRVFDHSREDLDLSMFQSFFDKHSKLNLEKLTSATSLNDFVSCLKGTEYYSPLSKIQEQATPLLFDYSMALDQYYFANIWSVKDKLFKKRDLQEIIEAYGNKFDMLNLQWIYRSRKYYHMDPADIYSLLIPVHYKLSRKEITALTEAPDSEEFRRVLDQTAYKKRYPELTPETLEEYYTINLRNILLTESRKYPHSVIMIYAYLYQKEHEVDRLTTAIECVRYGLPPTETLALIYKN